MVRMTNVGLEPGPHTFDEIIADTDDGIYMETNRSWSIDDRRLNFQFGTEVGYEVKNGERVKVPGVLESFNLAQEDAELLILQARVAAGWIDASELPQPEPEYEDEGEYAEGEYDPDQVFGDAPAADAGDDAEAADASEPTRDA